MKHLKISLSIIIVLLINNILFAQKQFNHLCSHKHTFSTSDIGDTLDALHYDIYLDVLDFSGHIINGYTDVSITPKINNLNNISLELLELSVDSVFIDGNIIPSFTYNNNLIQIPLSNPINIGDIIIVRIYYHGVPFHEDWGGFHFSGEYAFNLGVGFVSDPHNLGKAWFPCIDDFKDRATYDCYITVDEDKMAVCGGTLISVTNNGNNTKTCYWQLVNTIPTYLASVAVGEYAVVEDIYNGINNDVPVEIYVRPSDTVKVPGSFLHLNDILLIFEEHFGAYPWERVGYVGTAKGAMEHVTNIAYPNFCIDNSLTYEWLYAHELSHMWFGDKVTCSTAGDMWLNEGWAVFCESLYREFLYGKELYITNMRELHKDVLQVCHTPSGDGSYLALYGVPTEYTYGMTVYDC